MTVTAVTGKPPSLSGGRFMGSATELKRDALGTFVRAQREHGDVVFVSAGPPGLRTSFYGVFHPDGVQRVLATRESTYRKDNPHWQEMREVMGNGLVVAQDEDWRYQRRVLQPLFTPKRVDGYAEIMAGETEQVIRRWRQAEDGVIDLRHDIGELALQVVGRILFGDELGPAIDAIQQNFPVLNNYIMARGLSPVRVPQTWPTPGNRKAAEAKRRLYAVCDRIIAGHREQGEANRDFVGLMLRARADDQLAFDDEQVRDQVLLFMLAGHETTATVLMFAVHLLSAHPDCQEQAYAEVSSVLDGRAATAADLERLPYLKMVLKETMRLYPSIPLVSRLTPTGDEINGYHIPPGSAAWTMPWVTHRHPEFWPDPERFDPDRFLPEQEATRHRFAWFPFGAGPRTCIGQHFSMLELTIALASIVDAFELKAVETDVPVAAGISLASSGELHCVSTPRKG
jgi:cytochrome P450